MDVLIISALVIILQSSHCTLQVYTILFVNYSSVKLKKKMVAGCPQTDAHSVEWRQEGRAFSLSSPGLPQPHKGAPPLQRSWVWEWRSGVCVCVLSDGTQCWVQRGFGGSKGVSGYVSQCGCSSVSWVLWLLRGEIRALPWLAAHGQGPRA